MATKKTPKTKRTTIKDIAASEKQLTASEIATIKGGAGISGIKVGLGKQPSGQT